MSDDYTKQPKLPEGAKWIDVEPYYYEDLTGEFVLKVTRQVAVFGKDPVLGPTGKQRKQFPSHWIKYGGPKPKHQRGLLYHVKKIRAAVKLQKTILLPEGEACADLLRKWGFEATCNMAGRANGLLTTPKSCTGLSLSLCPTAIPPVALTPTI